MENRTSTLEIVMNNIKKYDINQGQYETLRPKQQEQLLQIENYLQNNVLQQKELEQLIKDSKLNLYKVVNGSGLQRSTVYNNAEILKVYIEQRIEEIEKEDILSIAKQNNQQEEMQFLKQYLNKTQENLISNQILEMKIESLEIELLNINKINESLLIEINQLRNQNNTLKMQNSEITKNNVIKLNKN